MAIVVDSSQGQGNSIGTSSSVSGTDITMVPRVNTTETSYINVYKNVSGKVTGVNGLTPQFIVPTAQGSGNNTWDTSDPIPVFSYDGLAWTVFGNSPTFSGGNLHITHSSAFTQDTVWFARTPRITGFAISNWLTTINSTYPGQMTNVTGGSGFIVDTFSSQNDELGRAIGTKPLYAFRLGNRGKWLLTLTGGVHAGEDPANKIMMYAVEYLMAMSVPETVKLRSAFDVLVLPLINIVGRDGGQARGGFQYNGTNNDLNRHFDEVTPGLENVTKPRAVFQTEFALNTPKAALDYHTSQSGISNECGYYSGLGDSLSAQWIAAMNARMVANGLNNLSLIAAAPGGTMLGWFAESPQNFPLSTVLELSDYTLHSDARLQLIGQISMLAIYDMLMAGNFGAFAPTFSPFARRRV